jgi:hypothetical protein
VHIGEHDLSSADTLVGAPSQVTQAPTCEGLNSQQCTI